MTDLSLPFDWPCSVDSGTRASLRATVMRKSRRVSNAKRCDSSMAPPKAAWRRTTPNPPKATASNARSKWARPSTKDIRVTPTAICGLSDRMAAATAKTIAVAMPRRRPRSRPTSRFRVSGRESPDCGRGRAESRITRTPPRQKRADSSKPKVRGDRRSWQIAEVPAQSDSLRVTAISSVRFFTNSRPVTAPIV